MLLFTLWVAALTEGSGCSANSDCDSGLQCRSNICVIYGTGDSCRADNDCSSSLGCLNGVCTKGPSQTPPAAPAPMVDKKGRPIKTKIKNGRMRYHDGDPIPPGGQVIETPNVGLWVSGVVLLSTAVATGGITTAALCQGGCPRWAVPMAWVPVAGPIALAAQSTPQAMPFFISMAVSQAGALSMLLSGVFVKQRWIVFPNGPGVAAQGSF